MVLAHTVTHNYTYQKSEIAQHDVSDENEICEMAVWPLHTQSLTIIPIKSLK